MLNLSNPEAIQAHKDYAKKTCSCCGVDISSKRSNAKFCSVVCKNKTYAQTDERKLSKKAYAQSDNGRVKQRQYTSNYSGSEIGRVKRSEYQKDYRLTESGALSVWSHNQKNSKLALRVNSMFTNATERQRHRLANWLLRVNHKSCVYYAVDDWIADYNTSFT